MTVAADPRATVPLVRQEVRDLLLRSPAFRSLDSEKRNELAHDLVNVSQYIVDAGGQTYGVPLGAVITDDAARALADDDHDASDRLVDPSERSTAGEDFDETGATAAEAGGQAFTEIISEVDFPGFVSGLIDGVFGAIVNSSIQQMEAFAELVKNVTKSVDEYMRDNVTENQARDNLVDRYPDHLQLDVSGPEPRVTPRTDNDDEELPNFFADLGLDFPVDQLDDETVEQVLVPAARQQLAIDRQRMLLLMVTLGVNRLVVTDGSIRAAVVFQLRTRDAVSKSTEQTATEWERHVKAKRPGFWGWFSGKESSFDSSGLNVTTVTDDDSEASVDIKTKLSGSVDVRFRSETFPLTDMTTLLGLQEPTLPVTQPRGQAES